MSVSVRRQLYDEIGARYATGRHTDARWMRPIDAALGDARSVLDVGAGTGSYEPESTVLAVEPSLRMIGQRGRGRAPAVRAVAEGLPLRDDAVDAALAVLTVHHWTDWRRGLAELRRVARRQVVLAYDTTMHADYWLVREYVPEIAALELARPSAADIARELGNHGPVEVTALPVPWDFRDGVFPAYWRRPWAYLDPDVRANCSALAQTDQHAVARGVERLRSDLESGAWQKRHVDLLAREELDVGFRVLVAR